MNHLTDVLKYADLFGTHFNFYTDKKRKFYTSLGGILTLLSFVTSLLVFILINYDELLHNNPISTTSYSKEPYRNVRFLEEKIWIPWRIRDYRARTFNFTGVFYPIAFYYHATRNFSKDALDLEFKVLDYKLCNETSMSNYTDSYILDIELSKLYCIEMDYLDMGGGWDTDQINYIQLDLYTCKNGIDYNESDGNCSSYEKIVNSAGDDNSFSFDVYYPVVHYQPKNKTKPIFVRYDNYFYHLSRYSNKIDRLYLQQYILTDDNGYFVKNKKNYSHWGYISLTGDNYATGKERDILNEGSSSRLYSFNIYLKFDVVYYNRYYKKIFLIIADGISIIFGIFSIFRSIAKIFVISLSNKKLTELLFENIQNRHKSKELNFNDLIIKQNISIKKKNLNISKNSDNKNRNNNNNTSNNNNNTSNLKSNINDASSDQLVTPDNRGNKNELLFPKMIPINPNNLTKINNCRNLRINNNMKIYADQNRKNISSKHLSIKDNNIDIFRAENFIKNHKYRNKNIKRQLFPYKYYVYSMLFGGFDLSKNSFFITKKFIVVYHFICQLFDISTYLIMKKEIEILKSNFIKDKYRTLLENRKKVNINGKTFNIDMKDCLDKNNFSILGQLN
jgi:hypothetical protein